MLFLKYLIVILAPSIRFSVSLPCQSLDQVNVFVLDRNGSKFNKVIDGCIQRTTFDPNTTVLEAHIKEQNVRKLGRDTVRNMKHLRTVSFVKCNSDSISPIAFRNVPNLLNIEVSECKLSEIGVDIFTFDLIPKLETLALDHNEINYIEDKAFLNLTSLRKINFNHNKLEVWRQEWFENTATLETLDFRHNKIRELPRRAFMEIRTLQQINFEHNEITKIQRDAFKNLRSLEYLGLGHNKLTVLDSNSFPNTVRIDTFTIHGNYLNYISKEVLKKLAAIKIAMDYNPWKCECLERINNWLYLKNGNSIISDICKKGNIPICAYSEGPLQSCSDSVDIERTMRYINLLKNLSTPLDPSCARLD